MAMGAAMTKNIATATDAPAQADGATAAESSAPRHYLSLTRQAKLLREAAERLRHSDAELAAACLFGASMIDGLAEPHGPLR